MLMSSVLRPQAAPPRAPACHPQVLTSQYQRAIAAKVEAEEALLQAQNDAAQLISLCEFCKCS